MSRNPAFFEMSESPFKVYESNHLDWETPKSSHQHLKRTFNSIENHDVKIKCWSQLFLSKYSNQLNCQATETPPTRKLDSSEPLAPIKHRRSINKSELKPKKLIFKDLEDYESGIVGLLSPLSLKSKKKIVVRSDDQSTGELLVTKERKQRLKESGRSRVLQQPPSDDKENRIESLRNRNKEMSKQPLKEQPKANPNDRGLKHLRI
ncbi:uncharacterized protein LOC107042464 [Diachasma alloeum]|uniref:uncharacterized protein LOC107042464 n=1 Tax=Diachasma alloeum TaxID=454923 RepID=UPI0007383C33|nr:uncharacterized protein LOC107042464 [Diachasma alloeum]